MGLAIAALLSGYAPPPSPPTAQQKLAPEGFPEAYYRQAEVSESQNVEKKILRIEQALSLVTIEVRRGGLFTSLGHDHIVASHHVTGYVDVDQGRADLYIPLDQLIVDEAALRAEAGFTSQPSADAIAGTRRNMLDKVLESGRYPHAFIQVAYANSDKSKLNVTITLHGMVKIFEVPAKIETRPNGLKITGQMTFKQTDFGMTPLSILGGVIQVKDELVFNFRLVAASH